MGEKTQEAPKLAVEPLEVTLLESIPNFSDSNQSNLDLEFKISIRRVPILKGRIDYKYRQIYKTKSKRQMSELRNALNSSIVCLQDIADRFHNFTLSEIEIISQYLKAKQTKKEFTEEEDKKLMDIALEFGFAPIKMIKAFPNKCFRKLKERYYKLSLSGQLKYILAKPKNSCEYLRQSSTTLNAPKIEPKKASNYRSRRNRNILLYLRIQKATEHFNLLNASLDQEYIQGFNELLVNLIININNGCSISYDESKLAVDNISEKYRFIESYFNLHVQEKIKKINLPYQRNVEPLSAILLSEMNYILKIKLSLVNSIRDLTLPFNSNNNNKKIEV